MFCQLNSPFYLWTHRVVAILVRPGFCITRHRPSPWALRSSLRHINLQKPAARLKMNRDWKSASFAQVGPAIAWSAIGSGQRLSQEQTFLGSRASGSMRPIFGEVMKRLLKQPDRRLRLDIDGYRAPRSSEAARFLDQYRRRPRLIPARGKWPGAERNIRWSPSGRDKPLIVQLPAS